MDKPLEVTVSADIDIRSRELLLRERGALARVLHDEVASAMFAAKLELDVASRLAGRRDSSGKLQSSLSDAVRCANEAMGKLRAVCADLRSAAGDRTYLLDDLLECIQSFERRTAIACVLSTRCDSSKVPKATADRILRAVREKLLQIEQSFGVTGIQITLSAKERHYDLKLRVRSQEPERLPAGHEDRVASARDRTESTGLSARPDTERKSTFSMRIPRVMARDS